MRFVFVGATQIAVTAASLLMERGHTVVVVEADRARIDALSDELDCGFLHGDGSSPPILREAVPEETDVLFCLTGDDRVNVLAALIGRSLGFRRVVPSIRDPELIGICRELGLDDTIVPDRTIGRYLADIAIGVDILELSTMIRGEARYFSFVLEDPKVTRGADLHLPEGARLVCSYRDDEFRLADDAAGLAVGDEIVIVTHSRHLPELRRRWKPHANDENADAGDHDAGG